MFRKVMLMSILMIPLAGYACPYGPKQNLGTLLGAVVGAGVGSALGRGHRDENAAIAAGAIFGGLFGYRLGAQLDALDRQMAGRMLYTVLEKAPTGETGKWLNPNSDNYGWVTATSTTLIGTPGYSHPCREFTTTIVIGGKEYEGYGTACRQADGSWKISQ